MFIEDKTLQHVLVKLNDLATNELLRTKELELLPIELEDLQPIEFEPVSNHLTLGSIKGKDVHVHYYHDVHVLHNNVVVNSDQNDVFKKAFIDIYILGVSNPEGCVHS
jgi:hypothetical protein